MIDGLESERMMRGTTVATFALQGFKRRDRHETFRKLRERAKTVAPTMMTRRQIKRKWDRAWDSLAAFAGGPRG